MKIYRGCPVWTALCPLFIYSLGAYAEPYNVQYLLTDKVQGDCFATQKSRTDGDGLYRAWRGQACSIPMNSNRYP